MRSFLTAIPVAVFAACLAVFRVKAIALASLLLILTTGSFSQSVFAQSKCDCWKDAKTGKAVPGAPAAPGAEVDLTDPNRAFNPANGANYYRDQADCKWKDAKTGKAVEDAPAAPGAEVDLTDPNRAFNPANGANYVRVVPCPPQTTTTTPPPVTTTPAPAGVGMLIVEPRAFSDLIEGADARTAGVPKPSEETQKVEEKKEPRWWESLIPSIGIGVGGGREDRERRFPDDPRR